MKFKIDIFINPIRSGGGSHCPPKWKTRVLIFFALMTSNFFYLLFILCKYASFGIFFRSIDQLVMVLRPLKDGSQPISAINENQFLTHLTKYFIKQKLSGFVNLGPFWENLDNYWAKNTIWAFLQNTRHLCRKYDITCLIFLWLV